MIIIYYRDKKTGKIGNPHPPRPTDTTLADLAPLIAEYNSQDRTNTAEAVEVDDDSLEAYLFTRMRERAKLDQETVQDAIEAIQNALDYVRSLEG